MIGGLCCCVAGLYTDTTDCLGCEAEQTVCCLAAKSAALKDCNSSGPKYCTEWHEEKAAGCLDARRGKA